MVAEGVFSTGRTDSYCTVGEVLRLLQGHDLSGYGTAEELSSRASELLPVSRSAVERYAGRDFFRHADVSVVLDGRGTDRVFLGEAGVCPPLTVDEVEVSGRTLGAGEWAAYAPLGIVRLTGEGVVTRFPTGVQNVTVRLSWGYEAPPEAVAQAQARIAAAQLLGEVGGEAGGVTATRIGDYAVSYGREGRHAGVVARLCEEAREGLASYRVVRMRTV